MIQKVFNEGSILARPDSGWVPPKYADDITDLFDTWGAVRSRNINLTNLYRMERQLQNLGITEMPESLRMISCVMGWPKKAVDVIATRSQFDGFVFKGNTDQRLNRLVKENRLRTKYSQAWTMALVHGLSNFTIMHGLKGQPRVKVRVFSANQSCVLWDKDSERVKCGIVLADVDRKGRASKYILHEPDAVVTITRVGKNWAYEEEHNPMGRPLIEPLIHDADLDRPLGHSRITPEVIAITDKAMRDVMNMEVGAAFWTWPQRYMLGVDPDLINDPARVQKADDDNDGEQSEDERQPTGKTRLELYLGEILALTKDSEGDIPTVGQFQPLDVSNLTKMFENDAQRFSGATNVPLGQLGVMSNTYTSSDALGAANNPLILDVERMNDRNQETLETIARMMMAIDLGVTLDKLSDDQFNVVAHFDDPSKPTISALADAWTKLGSNDKELIGTRPYYEGIGLPSETIDRIESAKAAKSSINALNRIADVMEHTTKPKDV